MKTIIDLYAFIGVPVYPQMLSKVKEHFNAEKLTKDSRYKAKRPIY